MLTSEQVAAFNPNYQPVEQPARPVGSPAAALDRGGLYCQWKNPIGGDALGVSVVHLSPSQVLKYENEANSNSQKVVNYGNPSIVTGFFNQSENVGEAQFFTHGYWVTLTSSTFVNASDASQLAYAIQQNLNESNTSSSTTIIAYAGGASGQLDGDRITNIENVTPVNSASFATIHDAKWLNVCFHGVSQGDATAVRLLTSSQLEAHMDNGTSGYGCYIVQLDDQTAQALSDSLAHEPSWGDDDKGYSYTVEHPLYLIEFNGKFYLSTEDARSAQRSITQVTSFHWQP